MATFKALAQQAPRIASYVQTSAAGTAPDAFVFINPTGSGEYFDLVEVNYNYEVAGGSGAQADVKIVPSGTALASGTTALASVLDLTATARTPRQATLTTTAANRTIKPGDSLAIDTGGTLTNLAGLAIRMVMKPTALKKTH